MTSSNMCIHGKHACNHSMFRADRRFMGFCYELKALLKKSAIQHVSQDAELPSDVCCHKTGLVL